MGRDKDIKVLRAVTKRKWYFNWIIGNVRSIEPTTSSGQLTTGEQPRLESIIHLKIIEKKPTTADNISQHVTGAY